MHQEAITSEAGKALAKIKSPAGFYLAGGTALALQLGHRISYDLDFFSAQPIAGGFLPEIEDLFAQRAEEILVNNADQLTLRLAGVKLTFLHYPFPLIFPLREFNGLPVADIGDIAAMKAYVIGRRGTLKDYVDLFFIIKGGLAIGSILDTALKKFGGNFNDRLFLEQLVYFKDIPEEEVLFLFPKVFKEEMEKFFRDKIAEEFGSA